MTPERRPLVNGEYGITGEILDPSGKINAADVVYVRGGKLYIVPIATPQFLQELHEYNEGFDENNRLGEDYKAISDTDLENSDLVSQYLRELPDEEIVPYLQDETENRPNRVWYKTPSGLI